MAESSSAPGARPPVLARRSSLAASLLGVVVRPAATFRDLAQWPRWLAPLVVVIAAQTVITLAVMPIHWSILSESFEAAGGPADMKPVIVGSASASMIAGALLGTPFWAALLAVVMWGWAKLVDDRRVAFVVAFAAAVHVGVVPVLRSLAGAGFLVFGDGVDLVARGLSPTSRLGLGALLDPDELPLVLYAALAHVEVFTVWLAVLIGVAGVQALGLRKSSAAVLAGLAWLVNGIIQVGTAAVSMIGAGAPGPPVSL